MAISILESMPPPRPTAIALAMAVADDTDVAIAMAELLVALYADPDSWERLRDALLLEPVRPAPG